MFNGVRLRQARELRRLTQTDLAARVGKSQGAIANIERGVTQPSPEMIFALAQNTRFPPAFFDKEQLREFPLRSLMLRAKAATTKQEVVSACRYSEVIYEVYDYLRRFVNPIPVCLQTSAQEACLAARQVRRGLGVPLDKPIPHVIHEIEKAGVIILALPLDIEKLDAFSVWITDTSPLPIIVACHGKSGDRMRWSMAHELGHLVLHSERKILRREQHQEADRFAAEFLLPEEAMYAEMPGSVTLSSLAPLKLRWRVSLQALVLRAYELKIITRGQRGYLFAQISAKGWRMREPANLDIPLERPRALMKMAELATGSPVNFSHIAVNTKLSEQMIKEILNGYDDEASLQQDRPQTSNVIQFVRK